MSIQPFDPDKYVFDTGFNESESWWDPFDSDEFEVSEPVVDIDVLKELNDKQIDAVEALKGPVLVVAGPGSGKTRVLTHRVAALLADGVLPWKILAVTFTNKAAAEMRSRIEQLVGPAASDVWVSTFHSLCVRIIRPNAALVGLPSSFSIFDSSESRSILKSVLVDLGFTEIDKTEVNEYADKISHAKNQMKTPDDYETFDPTFAGIFSAYSKRLLFLGATDFDDLLLLALKILRISEPVLQKYQSRFEYVMVDEYQDTNLCQYQLMKLLAAPNNDLCVVGDLDQSIYAWRGASPRALDSFLADYPDNLVVILDQNYRSTKNILKTCQSVIDPNPALHRANLWTNASDGDPVRLFVAEDDRDEAAWIVSRIQKTSSYSDNAILFRTNSQTLVFENLFRSKKIPYRIIGGLKFFDRAEVKDSLAYLRLVMNPFDSVAFSRSINTPRRGLGQASVDLVAQTALDNQTSLLSAVRYLIDEGVVKGKRAAAFESFLKIIIDVAAAANDGPGPALDVVAADSGLREFLDKKGEKDGIDRAANLDVLVESAYESMSGPSHLYSSVVDVSDFPGYELTRLFLETAALTSDEEASDSDDAVMLITVHASKGKEFEHVYVTGVEDGLFPHARSNSKSDLEEERRLLFVACSRAKQTLTLSRCRSRFRFGSVDRMLPSPFLSDLPDDVELVEAPRTNRSRSRVSYRRQHSKSKSSASSFELAMRSKAIPKTSTGPRISTKDVDSGSVVEHSSFGVGTVLSVSGTLVEIDFSGIKRTLDLEFAPLVTL